MPQWVARFEIMILPNQFGIVIDRNICGSAFPGLALCLGQNFRF